MAKPLTPEQLKLAEELKEQREELYQLAKTKRNQMIKAFKQYSKLQSAHEHFVDEHDKIDRKLFLLTPGIRVLKAIKRAERKTVAKPKKNSGASIAELIGNDEMEAKIRKMIAEAKRKQTDG